MGTWQIQLSDILSAMENLVTHLNSCCRDPLGSIPESDNEVLKKFNILLHAIRYYREPVDKTNPDMNREFGELDIIFRTYTNRKCHDRRDRIYGFLGMVGSPTTDFSPDYNLSHYEAYTSAMHALSSSLARVACTS
jgi:hypothetical protein